MKKQTASDHISEINLKTSEFKLFIENLPVPAVIVNKKDSIVAANLPFEKLIGYEANELLNLPVQKLYVNPDERTSMLQQLDKSEQLSDYTVKLRRADTSVFWGEFNIKQLKMNGNICHIAICTDITERPNNEKYLQQREQEYRALINSMENIVMYFGANRCLKYINTAALDAFGISETEVRGQKVEALFEEIDQLKYLDSLNQAYETGKQFTGTFKTTENGQNRWIRTKYIPHLAPDQTIAGLLYIAQDITEFRESNKKLNNLNIFYTNMLANFPLPVWMAGSTFNFTMINQTWETFTGRVFEDEKEHQWQQFIHPDDLETCLEIYNSAYASQANFEAEMRILNKDSDYVWVVNVAAPFYNANDEFEGYIGTFYNINDRKLFHHQLEQNERRFRTVFEHSAEPMLLLNFSSQITDLNDAACQLLGYTKEELKGTDATFISDRNAIPNDRLDQQIDQENMGHHMFLSTNIITKTGQTIPIIENSQIIDYKGNKEILIIIKDASKSHRENREILSAVIATEDKERQRFAEELHDDLGPLLSAIKMNIGLLKAKILPKEQAEETFENTHELIKDAIQTTRAIANNLQPNVLTNFGLINSINSFIQKIQTPQIDISFEHDSFESRLSENIEVIIYRAVKELINNSIKHASPTKITIELRKQGSTVVLRVSDNGKGFDVNEEIEGGKGMGLRNILNRIDSIGGQQNIRSEKGKGTTSELKIDVLKKRLKYP